METILTLNNLTKHYGKVKAVNDLSFTIEKGNVYGILGPNGSGKSTTLGMVLNVVNATSGTFKWFDGSDTTHNALKKVGAIIERPNFYPYMTAAQNLELVCTIKDVDPSKIEEKLEIVHLLDRKDSKFSTFSLGMKQRLAIASALLNDPEILILDEPTNGLDPQGIHQIREIIKNIASGGTTILLASHLLDEVEKVCSHVVIIRKGVKLYAGPVDELNASHGFFELRCEKQTELIQVLERHQDFASVKEENGLVTAFLENPLTAEELNTLLFTQGIVLSHLVKRKESLEEQFLQLTANLN
ncbi:MAG: ATP-binding cassette domain-containing protein [Bacteroidota bacterium]|uniref:ABC transporter ATP-binding protein n=1 Tax=Leeuwenhoekiella palythoae TaxID=573501 RepID=UPI000E9E0896|nr:ATP-binding cassette domain-containing protein [Leeuwenhoekiella palythoae]MEC7783229.1 ATP-binding cassette domain-containing protein [Bacteroidota bacterium]HAX14528.1 ABC transporter ATP-binding protein [Leeuwenhoekiella sp.]MEE3148388.1 ATP-binding cassette domain-containing protein [Bacteroidota bacterium]MEE3243217.1 ATP-binding cassette domain-containing protein [Bacteroidota bacterium]UBZ09903.1 ATP-binding cassette domain-containing protein [Leeuwenhoekiella palythoae]